MTERRLTGQPALVTGASSGIGRAVAIALGAEGAPVAVNYAHDRDGADAAVHEIVQAGGRAIAVQADVSQRGGGAGDVPHRRSRNSARSTSSSPMPGCSATPPSPR